MSEEINIKVNQKEFDLILMGLLSELIALLISAKAHRNGKQNTIVIMI